MDDARDIVVEVRMGISQYFFLTEAKKQGMDFSGIPNLLLYQAKQGSNFHLNTQTSRPKNWNG